MHATEVIETYIGDTVRFLPKRQRDDVATELTRAPERGIARPGPEIGTPVR
jgi:hypothetical protein